MNPGTLLVSPADRWAEFAAVTIAERLRQRQSRSSAGGLAVALAGGSTPAPVYEALSQLPQSGIDWQHVNLFLSDERMVPLDHAESNYRSARAHLLDRLSPSRPTLHAAATSGGADGAARRYETLIRQTFALPASGLPVFDLVILGLGEDGHTASLFPGEDTLRERVRLVLPARHPETGQLRVTFSIPLLAAAHHLVFLVAGSAKAGILKRIYRERPDLKLPAAQVATRARQVWWLVDEPAAAGVLGS